MSDNNHDVAYEAEGGLEVTEVSEEVKLPQKEIEEQEEIPDVGRDDEIIDDVKEYFDENEDSLWGRPDDDFLETSFFDFEYLEHHTELERYWVNKPYAYVSIIRDEDENEELYHVTEPDLDEFERYVSEDLTEVLRDVLLNVELAEGEDRTQRFRSITEEIITEYSGDLLSGSLYKVYYYLRRHFLGFGKVDAVMGDAHIEDISCDGVHVPVFVYHQGYRDLETNIAFEKESVLNSFVIKLAQRSGKHISLSNPLVDASLPNGSRVQLTLGNDISSRGSNFTIRKFSDVTITPVDLINFNTFSVEEMAYLWLCIENGKSLIFAGGTASGKTTSMNAVSFFIPPKSKIISIEDTREIDLPHMNWIQSVTRQSFTEGERGSVDMYDLLQAALRQRPEYLLVGEIRAQPDVALTFFQALATGHTSYTTFHADSVESLINRLENEPLNVPRRMIQALDIVAVQKQIYHDGHRIRRSSEIVEIDSSSDGNKVTMNDMYRWRPETDSHQEVGNSVLLKEIKEFQGWSDDRVQKEVENRRDVLRYMVDNGVDDSRSVGKVLELFWKDKNEVLEHVRSGTPPSEILGPEREDGG